MIHKSTLANISDIMFTKRVSQIIMDTNKYTFFSFWFIYIYVDIYIYTVYIQIFV